MDLTSKTAGEALRKVKGAGPCRGLEAYRRLSDWYLILTSATLHQLRTRVMKPRIATKEAEIGTCVEQWRDDLTKLMQFETAEEQDNHGKAPPADDQHRVGL